MKIPFDSVYFVWERWGGGCTMGCYQPMLACINMGINAKTIDRKHMLANVNSIKNSFVFIFKFKPSQQEINMLKNNNNVVVRYVGDGVLEREVDYHTSVINFDGLILGSHQFKKILDDNIRVHAKTTVIPANHDMFLDSERYKTRRNKKFNLFFGGSRDQSGVKTQGELGLPENQKYFEGYFHSLFYMYENMKGAKEDDLRKYVLNAKNCTHLKSLIESSSNPSLYSCHYGVRSPYYYDLKNKKTGGKVSTAAAAGSNIITSLDPSVRVLIDENYPYAIDTEQDDFLENHELICQDMIKKAELTFNTKTWFEGLKILEGVKERTKTERITLDYVNFGISIYDLIN